MVVHCSSYMRSMAWNRHVLHRRRLRRLGGHRKVPGRKGKVQKDGREGEICIFNFYWLKNVEMIWIFNRWIWISIMWKWKQLNQSLLSDLSFSHWSSFFPSRKNFDCVPWISCLQQFDSTKNKPSTSTSHMKECHDFDFFKIIYDLSILNLIFFLQGRQYSSDSGGRTAFGSRTLCRSWEGGLAPWRENPHGSTVNGWRGESPWGKVPISRQIEEIKSYVKRLPGRKIPMVENGNHVFVLFTATWYWMIGGMWHDSCFVFEFSIVGPTVLLIEICSLQISGRSIFNSPRSAIEDKEADVKADALRSLVKSLIGQATEIQGYGKCGDQLLDGFLLGWLLLLLQKLTW